MAISPVPSLRLMGYYGGWSVKPQLGLSNAFLGPSYSLSIFLLSQPKSIQKSVGPNGQSLKLFSGRSTTGKKLCGMPGNGLLLLGHIISLKPFLVFIYIYTLLYIYRHGNIYIYV